MIVNGTNVKPEYYVDIFTPGSDSYDIINGPLQFKEFAEWVETVDIPIIVNNLYHYIKEEMVYGRGIRKFMFWFLTEDDAKIFVDKWSSKYGMDPIMGLSGEIRYNAKCVVEKVFQEFIHDC